MKTSKLKNLSKLSGFTLVELMVGAVIFLGISAGAYKIFTSTTKKATEKQQETKQSRSQKQFFERFRGQIENTLQLPNAEGTELRVQRPDRCVDTTDTQETIGWSLVPFPGRTMAEIPANLDPFDPSISLSSSDRNDGIRIVYVTEDSVLNYLVFSGTPAVALPTTGNNPIVLDGPEKNLQVGDFAVISDAFRKDLIRITNITIVGSNTYIEHSSTKSIWNSADLAHNYGGLIGEYGQPVLFKVAVATYAFNTDNSTLMVDNHIQDDGFVAPNTWSSGLRQNWQAVFSDISKFQVTYETGNSETRTPQAGIPGKPYAPCTGIDDVRTCGCDNQLGNPDIKSIRIDIEYFQAGEANTVAQLATTSQVFNPAVLKKGLPSFGVATSGGCDGDILYNTNADGTPNEDCSNPACLCTDRVADTCTPPACGTATGGGGWGDGGHAG